MASLGLGPKSNGRTSNQDYTNLLYSDSESDRVPDLKLPPVKGKKQKRKKSSVGYRQEDSCDLCSVVKVFLLLILLAAVAALAGVTFWSLQKINSLQKEVDRLQQSDAFAPGSMTKFQTELVSVNKSVTRLRTGEGGTNALTKSIEALNARVKTLEDTGAELKKALASSKDLIDLPKKIDGLSSLLATMQSDVLGTGNKQKEIDTRLETLEKLVQQPTQSPGTGTGSSEAVQPSQELQAVRESVGQLEGKLQVLNKTVFDRISTVDHRFDKQEVLNLGMETFINNTFSHLPGMNIDVEKLVNNALQEVMKNATNLFPAPNADFEGITKQLKGFVDQLEAVKASQQDYASQGDLLLLKDDLVDEIKSINTSLIYHEAELQQINSYISILDPKFKDLISVVKSIKDHLNASQTASTSTPTRPTEEVKPSATPTSAHATTRGHGDQHTEQAQSTSEVETTAAPENKTLSMSQLHDAFVKINPDANALDVNELRELLKEISVNVENVESFDTDHDGLFSETEIATSLGITQPASSSSQEQ